MSIEETNKLLKEILEQLREVVKCMPKPKVRVQEEHAEEVQESRKLD